MSTNVVTRFFDWVVRNIIYNPNFWISIGSIGTFVMAILTYKLIKYYRKIDEERIHREMIENLIQPLITNLEEILSQIKYLSISRSYHREDIESVWKWSKLKQRCPYLVYRLPSALKEKVERFHKDLEKFVNLQNQCFYKLDQIISKEIEKKILEKIKEKTGRDKLINATTGTYYHIEIGGKRFRITFHELLFADQTLHEYIKKLKEDPTLPNKDVENEEFIGDSIRLKELNREDFQEIVYLISKKIKEDSKLKEFLNNCRELEKEAEKLRQNLSQAILKS